ncbi:MAG TPA: SseB family protein [Streptosporangiaceae bacterium]|nr:SseB family protein [Streptosporangiaceae bacterium]
MAGLNPGGRRPAGDDGTADPRLAAALAQYAAGQESERAMLTVLTGSRLLVPLVERPGEDHAAAAEAGHGEAGCDHGMAREMAFPTLIGRDGRPALLAFTSLAALVSWRPEARPVPTPAIEVWGSATGSQCAVVIDVAGPVPVAVDGARLAALAAGQPPPEPHTDPDVRADVATALTQAGLPAIAGTELAAGQDGTELTVRLLLKPVPGVGPSEVGQLVQQAAEAISARLGGRLRRGIAFSAAAPAAPAARPHG